MCLYEPYEKNTLPLICSTYINIYVIPCNINQALTITNVAEKKPITRSLMLYVLTN